MKTQDLTILVEHVQDNDYIVKIKQSTEKDINEIKKIHVRAASMEMAKRTALNEAFNYFLMIRLFTNKAERQLTDLIERLKNDGQ